MKISFVSDIHLEIFQRKHYDTCKALDNFRGGEILILAGDICYPHQLPEILDKLSPIYDKIIYLTGNHEYYGSTLDQVDKTVRQLEDDYYNFHFLNNKAINIEGIDFVGGTGWSNVRSIDCTGLNDFNLIRNMTPDKMSELHDDYKLFLKRFYDPDNKTVMISHFLPSQLLIEEKWRGDSMNSYFCNGIYDNNPELNPDYWIYGHDHNQHNDFTNQQTRFLTSQSDYGKVKFSLGDFEI